MKVEVISTLARLTKVSETFCVIRGSENLFSGLHRDIDCFVRADEFYHIDQILKSLGFKRTGIRRSALFYELNVDDVICIIDLHIDFAVHGVDWNIVFNPSTHCRMVKKVRILKENLVNEHKVLISIYQNKGLNPFDDDLPKFEQLQLVRPNKRLYLSSISFLKSKTKYKKIKFYRFLISNDLSVLINWTRFLFEKKLSIVALINFGKFDIRKHLSNLNTSSINKIAVKYSKDNDLRFGWPSEKRNFILEFLSTHTMRAKIVYIILKTFPWFISPDQQLPLYLNGKESRSNRSIVGLFFGTPSADRSILFNYTKSKKSYFLKFVSKNYGSNYEAAYEYKAIRHFGRTQDTFLIPEAKLYGKALITKKVFFNYSPGASCIAEHLKKMTYSQFEQSDLEDANVLLKPYESAIENKNIQAVENYQTLLSELKSSLLLNSKLVPTCWAHGDLTPWNIIGTFPQLTLIDFEKYKFSSCPAGYDLVHYYLSSYIFSNRSKYERKFIKTMKQLDDLWNLFDFDNKPDLSSLVCLVLLEYLKVAIKSESRLVQYNDLYRTAKFFIRYENT